MPLKAYAQCSNPSGVEAQIIYNSSGKVLQYCDGSGWVAMHQAYSGGGGCTTSTAGTLAEGSLIFNADNRVLQGCSGSSWSPLGPVYDGSKQLGNQWVQIDAGGFYAIHCGIKYDGTLWCWGNDDFGALGNGPAITGNQSVATQEATKATNWKQVSAGDNHVCAVKTNGTLWCWGSDSSGQLGNGAATTGNQDTPAQIGSDTDWDSVGAGTDFTCAIKTNGTLWCWGTDFRDELANGSGNNSRVSPAQSGTDTDWSSVDGGRGYGCGIKTTGTLWCWGNDNTVGLLGHGSTGNRANPTQEATGATNWKQVSTATWPSHTCAVRTDGTLWCWGSDFTGQLGNGSSVTANQNSPYQVGTDTDWDQVNAESSFNTCAVKTNGTLWCWGSATGPIGVSGIPSSPNIESPMQEETAATNWTHVVLSRGGNSSASGSACALKNNGSIACWGSNLQGQLANPYKIILLKKTPTVVPEIGNWVDVSVGDDFVCAIKTDGSMWCWGSGADNTLANGADTEDKISPTREITNATDWASVSSGAGDYYGRHACAIKQNGTLWCWGDNEAGQLGNGDTLTVEDSPVQEATSATNWAKVVAADAFTCALKTNGTIWCWGEEWNGQLGNGAGGDSPTPVQEASAATDWTDISGNLSAVCAVKTNGTLWCWGDNGYGQLGNNYGLDQDSPGQETTLATNWRQVSVGGIGSNWDDGHTCAVKTDGTLWCWGGDDDQQIGDGVAEVWPGEATQEITAATDWDTVSAGDDFTCATKTDGSAWCWGDNVTGQIGDDSDLTYETHTPTQIIASGISKISAGSHTTCAIDDNGGLLCWGSNLNGQLGIGKIGDTEVPVESHVCGTPNGRGGDIIYNQDANIMQYCDGVGWVAIGK